MQSKMNELENNIFINCPFDKEFLPLLRCTLFTTIFCDFNPRIATERFDAGEVRISKIIELIRESQYSIHDLSRSKASKKGEFFRLNMPFEIGIDLGCRLFSSDDNHKQKKILILENEKYNYQKSISDLAGSDIKCHNNNPEDLVLELRTWFTELGIKVVAGSIIWDKYNEFNVDFYEKCKNEGYKEKDFDRMSIREYIDFIKDWCNRNKK